MLTICFGVCGAQVVRAMGWHHNLSLYAEGAKPLLQVWAAALQLPSLWRTPAAAVG